MLDGSEAPTGPRLTPIDHHILDHLAETQWTTGALIDLANTRVYAGDLELPGIDPDQLQRPDDVEGEGDEDRPVSYNDVYKRLKVLETMNAVEYAHQPTSLYRLVHDPREERSDSGTTEET